MKFLYLIINLLSFVFISNAQIQWVHTNGPEGGHSSKVYSNKDFAFFSDAYFLYRTADGINWEKFSQGNLWPMAVNDQKLASFQGYGYNYGPPDDIQFMVSYDNGMSWQTGNLAPTDRGTLYPVMVCSHGIYGGAGNIMYKTVDDGLTWEPIPHVSINGNDLQSYDDNIFCQNGSNLYMFDPNNNDWIVMNSPFQSSDRLKGAFVDGQNIILTTDSKVFTTLDNGSTWKSTSLGSLSNDRKIVEHNGRIYTLSSNRRLAYSDDRGVTWIFKNLPVESVSDICLLENELLLPVWQKGVFRLNLETFTGAFSNSGLHSSVIFNLSGHGNSLWAGSASGLFRYGLLDEKWHSTPVPFPKIGYRQLSVSRDGFVACQDLYNDSIYVTKDIGQTWDTINLRADIWYYESLRWIDDKLIINTDFGPYVWHDNLLEQINLPYQTVYCNGKYYGAVGSGLVTSSDSGITWTEVTSNLQRFGNLISSGDRLFSYSNPDYLLYSSVDGEFWEYSGEGIPSSLLSDYFPFYDPPIKVWSVENKYFADFGGNGFYVSLDTSKTWLPIEKSGGIYEYLNGSFYRGYFGGGVFRTGIPNQYGSIVRGQAFNDVNNNGIKDIDESGIPDIRVSVLEPSAIYPFWFTSTDEDGLYVVSVTHGSEDTIRLDITSNYAIISPEYHLVIDPDEPYDFAVHFEPDITDFALNGSFVHRPRPGFDLNINVTCKNVGTISGDASVCLKLDPDFEFIQATPSPSSVYPDSLVWNLPSIPMFAQTRIQIQGKLKVDAMLGDELRMEAKVTTLLTDSDISNNVLILSDTIVGSFDPNEKRVSPQAGLTREEIAEGKELEYTIHFQNTGTYLAEKVILSDQLDTTLNWSSFRYIDASHPVTKWELKPGGLLRVEFDQINLPDSISNEPESHGYFSFAIRRNAHGGPFTNCLNSAAIFFDFNHPIITNTTVSRVINPVVVSVDEATFYSKDKNKLLFMPNPSGMNCMISTNQLLKGNGNINIYHSNGVFVRQIQTHSLESDFQLDTSDLPNGMYIITANGKEGSLSGKLIVLK